MTIQARAAKPVILVGFRYEFEQLGDQIFLWPQSCTRVLAALLPVLKLIQGILPGDGNTDVGAFQIWV